MSYTVHIEQLFLRIVSEDFINSSPWICKGIFPVQLEHAAGLLPQFGDRLLDLKDILIRKNWLFYFEEISSQIWKAGLDFQKELHMFFAGKLDSASNIEKVNLAGSLSLFSFDDIIEERIMSRSRTCIQLLVITSKTIYDKMLDICCSGCTSDWFASQRTPNLQLNGVPWYFLPGIKENSVFILPDNLVRIKREDLIISQELDSLSVGVDLEICPENFGIQVICEDPA